MSSETDIWIILIEDRHADVEALPFSSEESALEAARARAGHDGVTREEMTSAMRQDGWVLNLPISEEGDRIRVIKRTMKPGNDLSGTTTVRATAATATAGAIAKRIWEHDRSLYGDEVPVGREFLPYLEGLAYGHVEGATELIDTIREHGTVLLWIGE